ncbi:MAG: DUF4124 domain-containing protein [Xanthomonadales bacterium]|jgi:hypothetical protein|nr:DUF4124 domain-containing protein [Xanthomonadales bacterium]
MSRFLWGVTLAGLVWTLPGLAQAPAASAPRDGAATEQPASTGPKIYRWVDAAGRVQFGSSPPPGTRTEAVQVREQSLGSEGKLPAGLDVVDRRNKTAPSPSYDWDAERPQRLAEHCGFIRERVKEMRAGQEWIVLDWGKPPTRLDGPRRVEELVKRERLLKQYCEGY